jgi:integrase
MTSKALTDRKLQQLRPSEKRQEIADGLLRGLYFIVQPSSAKSWAVRYRIHGKTPVKETLGTWPTMSLKAAREAGRDKILAAKAGRDPRAERIAARAKAEAATANTVRNVCEAYLARESSKLRTGNERRRLFERLVYPAFGGRPIDTITRGELITFLDRVEDEHGTRMADVTLAAIRRVMNWYAVRNEFFRSPVVRGMQRQRLKDTARTRILNDDELRKIWTTATELPGPFPVFLLFLLLTAARRGEAARMTWSEVVEGDWILPAARNKVKEDLVRPLSEAARALLASLPRFPDGNDFVFTHDGRRAIGAFGRFKAAFDAQSGVAGYVLHDLRRTARSLMSRAGVPTDHAERVLGHVIGGVRGVYDRHEFHAEKKAALEALAGLIERIVNPPEENVVIPLRR